LDAVRVSSLALLIAASSLGSPLANAQEIGQRGREVDARIEALQPFITEAAGRFHVPETWIHAVIAAESGGRTELDGRPITSPAGAMGPMQVMPETYAELRLRYGLGPDPYDPEQNILAGTAYLAELYSRFGFTGAFAAYNAGPDRYQQFLATGRPIPAETEAYLAVLKVAAPLGAKAPSFSSGGSLFFQLQNENSPGTAKHPETNTGGLFVPLGPLESDPDADKKGH
jgi:soluble lytic murein transglycosylase-like protein